MQQWNKYRDPALGRQLLQKVRVSAQRAADRLGRLPAVMEVCGTHTMALGRTGIRSLLSGQVELKSGPGCPVCVTGYHEIDMMIAFSRLPGVTVATFGDMLRVPGSFSSLEKERSKGAEIIICYSPAEALARAAEQPDRQVVFLGIGFETTVPTIAATILEAAGRGIRNYSVYSTHKLLPPVLRSLLAAPDVAVDGLLLPGHVSAILGRQRLDFVAGEYGVPSVIAGFEMVDMLFALDAILAQMLEGRAKVINGYPRVVPEEGNLRALAVIDEVFQAVDASWRGLGPVRQSGLAFRPVLEQFDAAARFPLEVPPPRIPRGCRCGEVLQGKLSPGLCRLFARSCTPVQPVGPCMVSSEGACAAFYRYERSG